MPTRKVLDALAAAVFESLPDLANGDAEAIANYAVSETAFARCVVSRLLVMEPDALAAEVQNPCYQRANVAMTLLDAYDENSLRWPPERALAVTTAAVTIALSLRTQIPALACRALKEKANALRTLGRFEAASTTLAQAMLEARQSRTPELQVALVEYAMAAVFHDNLRPYDALRLLASARARFEAVGDGQRVKSIRTWEAGVLFSLSRFSEAADLFQASLSDAAADCNEEEIACATGNVALCCVMMGEIAAARGYFAVAAEMYESLGLVVCRARMLRSLGRLAIRERGKDGATEMLAALECFNDLHMVGESVLTRLILVEELLVHDANADVAAICREVFENALATGMDTAAATALGLLHDLAGHGLATPEFVREVSGCVDSAFLDESAAPVN